MAVMIFVCDRVVTMMTVVCFPAEFFRRHLCQDMAQVDVTIKIKLRSRSDCNQTQCCKSAVVASFARRDPVWVIRMMFVTQYGV